MLIEYSNLPLGAIVMGLVALFLRLPNESDEKTVPEPISIRSARQFLFKLDLGGTVLLVACMCSLFMAMQWGGHSLEWSSPTIIGLFAVFGVLLGAFLLLEWNMGDNACIPFRVLKQRSIASGVVYLFLFSMPNFSVFNEALALFSEDYANTILVWGLYTNLLSKCQGLYCAEKWHRESVVESDSDLSCCSSRSFGVKVWILCGYWIRIWQGMD